MWYNIKVAITILRKWEVISMRAILTLVFVPFLVSVASQLFAEWLIRKYIDKRDNEKQ